MKDLTLNGVNANPLLPSPPTPQVGREHRLGGRVEEQLRSLFGHLGPQFDDIHRGVFLTKHPLVAYAYAYDRRFIGENDYGMRDVIDPPVLIGMFIPPGQEFTDTDALQTARELLLIAKMIQREEEDDEDEEEERGSFDYVNDTGRSRYYSLWDIGLARIGGDVGNNPEPMAMLRSARKLAIMMIADEVPVDEEIDELPDVILEQALREAEDIIPQSRLIREVHENEVIAIVVLPPIREGDGADEEEIDELSEDPSDFLEDQGELDDARIRGFDRYLLDTGHVLYMQPGSTFREINRWHGTSLSIAKEAFPDIVTSARFWTGVEQGSAHDLDELARDYGEEDDD